MKNSILFTNPKFKKDKNEIFKFDHKKKIMNIYNI